MPQGKFIGFYSWERIMMKYVVVFVIPHKNTPNKASQGTESEYFGYC